MSEAQERANMALWQIGAAIRWVGGNAVLRYRYAADDLERAVKYLRQAEKLEDEAAERMAAAAVAPVEA